VGSGILLLPSLKENEKIPRPPLLKHPHQRTHYRLALVTRHLTDASIAVDIRPSDDLELEVSNDIGVYEHPRELPGGQDELGNKVDGVVAVSAEVEVGWRGGLAELLVQLPVSGGSSRMVRGERGKMCGGWTEVEKVATVYAHLGQVEGSGITTVVVVPVHVEDLLPVYRKQSREDALGKTGSLVISRRLPRAVISTRTRTMTWLSAKQFDCDRLLFHSHRIPHPCWRVVVV